MGKTIHILAVMAMFGACIAVYLQSYRTQSAIAKMQRIEASIAQNRALLARLQAEWAYLNRPQRLWPLVNLHFDQLELVSLQGRQFGAANQIPYPRQQTAPAMAEAGQIPAPQHQHQQEAQNP